MRLPGKLVIGLVVVAIAAAAGVGVALWTTVINDEPAARTDTAVDLSEVFPTDPQVKTAVYERSLSECASNSLERLAAQYHVRPTSRAVATGVANSWAERFVGWPADDAVRSGRDGCLQGFRMRKQSP